MNLTQMILCYQQGYLSLSTMIMSVRRHCLGWMLKKRGMTIEEVDEFFTYACSRLMRKLLRFRYGGTSARHYINHIIKKQINSYFADRCGEDRKQNKVLQILTQDYECFNQGHQLTVCSWSPGWPESQRPEQHLDDQDDGPSVSINPLLPGPGKGPHPLANRAVSSGLVRDLNSLNHEAKRLVLLALKQPQSLDDSDYLWISRKAGLSPLYLLGMRQEAWESISNKLPRLATQLERNNRNYFRLQNAELPATDRLRTERAIINNRKKLASMKLAPTHRELSQITGIPKGTIDSNLYNAHRRVLKTIS